MPKPKVLVADDHVILAQGLMLLLRDDFELVGLARDGHELVELAKQAKPDVIVTDLSMLSLNGMDAVGQLRSQGVTAKVIVLTQHKDPHLAAEAFRAGASGFVIKQAAGEELVAAINEVLKGRGYLTTLITKDLITVLGLTSMKERVRLAGEVLSVESAPASGTRIRVRVPFHSKAPLAERRQRVA